MTTLLAIEQSVTSFHELVTRFGLHRATDADFFSEWQIPTESIKESDKAFLDHIKQRYHNYYKAGLLSEGTVLLSIIAPLLEPDDYAHSPQ